MPPKSSTCLAAHGWGLRFTPQTTRTGIRSRLRIDVGLTLRIPERACTPCAALLSFIALHGIITYK